MKKGEFRTYITEIQRIINNCYEKVYAITLEN